MCIILAIYCNTIYYWDYCNTTIGALKNIDTITIVPLPDIPDDNKLWVTILDKFISSFLGTGEEAILYGGRDSFVETYKKFDGKFSTTELAPIDYDSGTELRALHSIHIPKYSVETASAILWTLNQLEDTTDGTSIK